MRQREVLKSNIEASHLLFAVPSLTSWEQRLLRIGYFLGTKITLTVSLATVFSVLVACAISLKVRGHVTLLTPLLATVCCVATALPVHLLLRSFTLFILRQQRELQQQHAKTEKLNTQLRLVNQDLSAFSHRVAHDLRNPLMVIRLIAQELSIELTPTPAINSEQSEILGDLLQASESAEEIIQAILLLSQARQSPPTLALCSPLSLLESTLHSLSYKITAHQAVITRADTPSIQVLGYAPWIERIWFNLIDNALKYGGEAPEITVGVTLEEGWVRCWVSDRGPGIPEGIKANLSHDFKGGEEPTSLTTSGFGIGLSLVYELVTHMRGQLLVENASGTTISFLLASLESE